MTIFIPISCVVAYAPSKTPEPAKHWGLPTLSQGAVNAPRKRASLRRRVDRAGCPQFFAPSTQPGVFIPIVAPSPGRGTLMRAESPLSKTHRKTAICEKLGTVHSVPRRSQSSRKNGLPSSPRGRGALWAGLSPFFRPVHSAPAFSFLSLPDRPGGGTLVAPLKHPPPPSRDGRERSPNPRCFREWRRKASAPTPPAQSVSQLSIMWGGRPRPRRTPGPAFARHRYRPATGAKRPATAAIFPRISR